MAKKKAVKKPDWMSEETAALYAWWVKGDFRTKEYPPPPATAFTAGYRAGLRAMRRHLKAK